MVQTGVIVAALLALGAGGALNPASAWQWCGYPDKEVGYSEEDEVMSSNAEGYNVRSDGYVQPGSDFRGISVKVNHWNAQRVYWFPADPCFPATGEKWVWMNVNVTMYQGWTNHGIKYCFIRFDLVTDYCRRKCERSNGVSCAWPLGGLSVVARGPSNWRSDHPGTTCLVNVPRPLHPRVYICEKPPPFRPPSGSISPATTTPTTTTTTPTTTTTTTTTTSTTQSTTSASSSSSVVLLIVVPVVAVVIFLVIVVVVVVVVVCRRRRRRRSAASRMGVQYHHQLDPPTPTQDYVIKNNLYEPLGGLVNPTRAREDQQQVYVVENNLYEPLPGPVNPNRAREDQQQVYVVENNLYEPLPGPVNPNRAREDQQQVYVVENNLYEPLPGPVNPTRARDDQQQVYVVENNLYEPLPGPANPGATWERQGTVVVENDLYEPLGVPRTSTTRGHTYR